MEENVYEKQESVLGLGWDVHRQDGCRYPEHVRADPAPRARAAGREESWGRRIAAQPSWHQICHPAPKSNLMKSTHGAPTAAL